MKRLVISWLVLSVALGALAVVAHSRSALHSSRSGGATSTPPSIGSVTFGTPFRYNSQQPAKWTQGDGWQNTWADDDFIYSEASDNFGAFSGSTDGPAMASGNFGMVRLSTYDSSMTGHNINPMTEFGNGTAPDGSTSKMTGQISINGVLYGQAGRGEKCGASQIIKSSDHWTTYSPHPDDVYGQYTSPMFPAPWGTGTFVQYGKDYANLGSPDPGITGGPWVYAIFGKCGPSGTTPVPPFPTRIGRVSVANIGGLHAADWTYYAGGDATNPANWISTPDPAVEMFNNASPCELGPWGVQYLPYFDSYIALGYTLPGVFGCPNDTTTYVHVSHKPWGPWSVLTTYSSPYPTSLYGTSVISKSVSVDGGQHITMSAAGYFGNTGQTGTYCIWITPMTVSP